MTRLLLFVAGAAASRSSLPDPLLPPTATVEAARRPAGAQEATTALVAPTGRTAVYASRAEYDELLVHYSTLKEQHRTCALEREERSLGLAPARGPLDVLLAAAHVVLRAGRRLLPLDLGLPGFKRPSAVESA